MKPLRVLFTFLLLSLALWTLAPDAAYARAGGGQRYSGGGGDGGGIRLGGGDSSGNGEAVFWLLWLAFRYPHIGLPLLAVAAIVIYYGRTHGKAFQQKRVLRHGQQVQDRQRQSVALKKIKEKDPGFDEEAFLRRAQKAFLRIQEAWCAQSLSPVRAFVSDGIYERFSLQIEEQKARGIRDRMDDLKVLGVSVVQVASDEQFDTVTVRIAASATDTTVDIETGDPHSKAGKPTRFVEFWTFLRKGEVRTEPGQAGLIEGACPNCGGRIDMNQAANCKYCGALLRSGEYDWVLAEITQECEWRVVDPSRVRGVGELRARDPEFSLVHMEDRASVVFWRKAMADRHGKAEPLRKITTDKFAKEYNALLRKDAAGGDGRPFYADCAVGAVDTVGVLPGKEFNRALVEVRWSGRRYLARPDGSPPEKTDHTGVFRSLFILERKVEARSEAGKAVSSAHCPNCGAPESGGASGACEYCGTVLNDGSLDWILLGIRPWADPVAQKLLQAVGSLGADTQTREATLEEQGLHTAGGAATLAWMVKVMLADGKIDEAERRRLETIAERRHIPRHLLDVMIDSAQAGTMEIPEPRDRDEAHAWLENMAAMAMADGEADEAEMEFLRNVAGRLGFSDYDVKLLLNKARSSLYREARALQRAAEEAQKGGAKTS